MAATSGIISRVSIKDTTPDNYGNDKLKSFQIEGDEKWYGLGKSKGDTINVKKGKDYVPVVVGDEIEFFYEESEYNGKTYYNAKSSQIKLVAKGTGQAQAAAKSAPKPAASAPARSANTGGSSGAKPPYEAGIKVGHAINNAVQLVCAEEGPITLAAIEQKAIAILKLSRRLEQGFESIFDNSYQPLGTKAAPQPEPEPEPEPEPTPEPEPEKPAPASIADFDDDIPF